ncbi:MAG: glucose-1-phosphate thymidylyltransferase [bacterium]
MKGLILSGGKGTRLRPLTHTSAKQLVPIANKPILFYALEALKEAGITDIGVVVGDTREEIKTACGNGSHWGVEITYIEQAAPLGLAHAVKISQDFLGDSDFAMYLGDNLLLGGITDYAKAFQRNESNCQILLVPVDQPEQFGIAELEGNRIKRLWEKPKKPASNLALAGIYFFDQSIFPAVDAIKPSSRGELEITDAIQYLLDNKQRVEHRIIGGWWKDTGKLEDMLEANRIILDEIKPQSLGSVDVDARSRIEGRVILEEGAEIINSLVRGPAIIGKNSRIINSFIGPYSSVYHNTTIENSELEHSIILENSSICSIEGKIVDSLVGKYVEITKQHLKPSAHRFMVGDYSKVGIL